MIDLNKFKDILKENKEIFIAGENGEPVVLMSLEQYKKLKSGQSFNLSKDKDEFNEDFNEDYINKVKKSIIVDAEDNVL